MVNCGLLEWLRLVADADGWLGGAALMNRRNVASMAKRRKTSVLGRLSNLEWLDEEEDVWAILKAKRQTAFVVDANGYLSECRTVHRNV